MRHTPFYLLLLLLLLFSRSVSAQTTQTEKRTDSITRLMIRYLNESKPDSAYGYWGEAARKQFTPESWRNVYKGNLSPFLPFSDITYTGSHDGMNIYTMKGVMPLNLYAKLDVSGKLETFFFQPVKVNLPQKTTTALSDNPLKSHLDSIVESAVRPYINLAGNVGLSAGVRYNGQDYFYNYGTVRLNTDTLPDNHTIYETGSITKTFTGTLLALAVIQKKVTLDQPITKFLPDSVAKNPALKGITLKQLANHTAGFPSLPSNLSTSRAEQPYENYDQAHLFSYLKSAAPENPPGKVHSYSNFGFGLLGVILERIYGMNYAALLSKYITGPQGLKHTGISVYGKIAQGYDGGLSPVAMWDLNAMKSAGAIKSDAADLLKYASLQLQQGKDPLQQACALAHQATYDDGATKIGLAWVRFQHQDDYLFHNGATGGYRSFLLADTSNNTAVVILVNSVNGVEAVGAQIVQNLKK
ncbi:serine hydrolase [[Flexibacter] sp. ATCC 35208]|uniref:serine hydrolase domain-containing protein n=1 Tax=[Flexibacter] sp. ATCC 35208 TaxID=1936242 RepID=UPI0009CCB5BE|nr:serine hydrolase domain-containing protein [[Flexibacter] sp. ATCC 35208]OMP75779.1 hypothetical protein BW716_28535 [[Flexibacter] sp. ATCC 35208]